jgi:NADPH:quinone reductase-like Zn-dependent oxidoreductase
MSSSRLRRRLCVARTYRLPLNHRDGHGVTDCTPRELHAYRGIQKSETGFIMGHEFVGTVVEAGSEVKDIKIGDKVVAPFTSSWYDKSQSNFSLRMT